MAGLRKRMIGLSQRLGFLPLRVRNPRPKAGQQVVHFIHIGKNAGTQIKRVAEALGPSDPKLRIVAHGHDVQLRHLPQEAPYFFSIRNPVTRFTSGFYNRKAKGLPVRKVDWSADEARAFATFEHASDLAEALFADGTTGQSAWAAMASLRHAGQHQSDWFLQRGAFLEVRPPVHILRVEAFESDFKTLCGKIDLSQSALPKPDKAAARVTDYADIPALSDKAIANLEHWYARDVAFYQICAAWIDAQSS